MIGKEERNMSSKKEKIKIFNSYGGSLYRASFTEVVQEFLDTHDIIDVELITTEDIEEDWQSKSKTTELSYIIRYVD